MNTLPLGHTGHGPDGVIWLALPYTSLNDLPSLNKRQHWALKAKQTQALREQTHWLAKKAKINSCALVEVELNYLPPDNIRRDTDNLIPILKACCDGLVDAGVVPDDTPAFMRKLMPLIHPKTQVAPGQSRLLLRVLPVG